MALRSESACVKQAFCNACRPRRCGVLLALLAATAGGCQAPATRVTMMQGEVHESLADSPFDPAAEARYVMCPGDELMIRFPTDSTLDQRLRVRSDGRISLSYVGDVDAAQRSPAELAAELNRRYEGVLKNANVAVIVLEEAGRRVYVGGQVRAPGVLVLQGPQTLTQTLFAAGGLTPYANTEQVIVLRSRPGDATYVLAANVAGILAGREADVRLEPLDIIHVPDTPITRINQFVEQYINAMIPRSVNFPFTTELATQPIRVIDNSASRVPAVQIQRQ